MSHHRRPRFRLLDPVAFHTARPTATTRPDLAGGLELGADLAALRILVEGGGVTAMATLKLGPRLAQARTGNLGVAAEAFGGQARLIGGVALVVGQVGAAMTVATGGAGSARSPSAASSRSQGHRHENTGKHG